MVASDIKTFLNTKNNGWLNIERLFKNVEKCFTIKD